METSAAISLLSSYYARFTLMLYTLNRQLINVSINLHCRVEGHVPQCPTAGDLQDSGEKDKNSSGRPAWHARPNDDSWRLDRRLTNLHTTSACTVLLGFRISIFTHSARTLSSIRISRAKYLGCSGAFKLHPHVLRVLAFYLGISRLYVTWPHELHLQTLRRCRPITAVYSIWKQHICLVSNTHHLDTWRVSCSPLVTHADSSRVSTAFIRLCVCVCVILSAR